MGIYELNPYANSTHHVTYFIAKEQAYPDHFKFLSNGACMKGVHAPYQSFVMKKDNQDPRVVRRGAFCTHV